jgi:hypothetical protein
MPSPPHHHHRLTDADGDTVTGADGWSREGGMVGAVVERHADGDLRWEGEAHVDGERHGAGRELLPDGAVMEGEWSDGAFEGDTNTYVRGASPRV